MFCSNCGAKLPDGANFCSVCGAKQASVEVITPVNPVAEAPKAVFETEAPIKKETPDLGFDWTTQTMAEPKQPAFDKRVSFDWTSVIDESHKKQIKEIRSPWDTSGLGVADEEAEKVSKVVEASHKDDMAIDFKGIDVTPSTEKGRTLSFIDILKRERAEKERIAEEATKALIPEEKPEDFTLFDEIPAVDEMAEYRKMRSEAAAEKTPVVLDPKPFVQPAEEEMRDIKAAYNESKVEAPAFEMPAFTQEKEEAPANNFKGTFSTVDLDEYLSLDDADTTELFDEIKAETPVIEKPAVATPVSIEPVAYSEPIMWSIPEDSAVEELLSAKEEGTMPVSAANVVEAVEESVVDDTNELEFDLEAELAAILDAGNGFIPTIVEPVAEASELPAFVEEPEADVLTDEEADAEELFAEMIDTVTDPANDPLAEVEHLTIEDIFPEAAEEVAEATDEVEPVVDNKESEIEALKRRLAELLGDTAEAKEEEVPASVAAATMADIFPEDSEIETLADSDEDDEEISLDNLLDELPEIEDVDDGDDFLSLFDQEEPVFLAEAAAEEPASEAPIPVQAEDAVRVIEEVAVEPAKEEKVTTVDELLAELAAVEAAAEEPAIEATVAEPELADIPTDAMSIEDLEKELFGDDLFGGDTEAEATRKIDKFYTLYKKNEEFQKLLDDEYNRLQVGDEYPEEGETADATVGQLDSFVLPLESLEPAEEADDIIKPVTASEVAGDDAFTELEEVAAPVAAETVAPEETVAEAVPAPVEEAEPVLDAKAAKKAAKKAKKEAARKAREQALEEEDEEEGSTFLTVIAVVIAIILIFLLAAILILNFAPESALGMKLDALVQSISALPADGDLTDVFLL